MSSFGCSIFVWLNRRNTFALYCVVVEKPIGRLLKEYYSNCTKQEYYFLLLILEIQKCNVGELLPYMVSKVFAGQFYYYKNSFNTCYSIVLLNQSSLVDVNIIFSRQPIQNVRISMRLCPLHNKKFIRYLDIK